MRATTANPRSEVGTRAEKLNNNRKDTAREAVGRSLALKNKPSRDWLRNVALLGFEVRREQMQGGNVMNALIEYALCREKLPADVAADEILSAHVVKKDNEVFGAYFEDRDYGTFTDTSEFLPWFDQLLARLIDHMGINGREN